MYVCIEIQYLAGGSTHAVSSIIVHELYNVPVRNNDIAVLVLSKPVKLGSHIASALIPMQGNVVPNNVNVQLVGWGRTNVSIILVIRQRH